MGGLELDWLNMAKKILRSGIDGINDYQQCEQVTPNEIVQWVHTNASKHQWECITLGMNAYNALSKAVDDVKTHKPHNVVLQDWANAFQQLNDLSRTCMWE